MSKMATTPVFACRRCGKAVYVTQLTTRQEDPKSELLLQFMQGLGKISLCQACRAVYNYLASVGRENEFYINPELIIYNVRDNSGLDYYGRKDEHQG